MDLVYPDGAHNAESMFMDPVSKKIFIVTKSGTGESIVFRKSPPHRGETTTTLTEVTRLDFSHTPLSGTNTTSADISADGTEILIKTYTSTFLWRRDPGATVWDAFKTSPCPISNGPGEAIGMTPDKRSYFTIAEGSNVALYRFDRQ